MEHGAPRAPGAAPGVGGDPQGDGTSPPPSTSRSGGPSATSSNEPGRASASSGRRSRAAFNRVGSSGCWTRSTARSTTPTSPLCAISLRRRRDRDPLGSSTCRCWGERYSWPAAAPATALASRWLRRCDSRTRSWGSPTSPWAAAREGEPDPLRAPAPAGRRSLRARRLSRPRPGVAGARGGWGLGHALEPALGRGAPGLIALRRGRRGLRPRRLTGGPGATFRSRPTRRACGPAGPGP